MRIDSSRFGIIPNDRISERAKQPPPEPPYRPYAKKPAEPELPYEPNKGM